MLNIAIIGAGPAGTSLARLLQTSPSSSQITTTIFDLEPTPNFRSQGGTLDLHDKTGQACLRAAGLYADFQNLARYDGEAMKIADKKLLAYASSGPGSKDGWFGTGRPEIDRPQLRELLYRSLKPGTVQWGKKLHHISPTRPYTLHFTDGSTASNFDLIVGADGAWSKTRTLLTDTLPFYSGIGGHTFRIPDAEQNHPDLYALVNRGSVFAFSDGKSIMAQYMSDGTLNISTWSVRSEDWSSQLSDTSLETAKAAVRAEFPDWDPRLVKLTQVAEGEAVARNLYMLPIGHKWEHREGVTLIGDASHVMTPFAGEGVNLALEDSLKLSQAILSALSTNASAPDDLQRNLDTHITAFEREMFVRATAIQQLTYDMLEAMFLTPGAPRQGIERYIIRAVEGEVGWWGMLVVRPVVWVWFWVFKMIW